MLLGEVLERGAARFNFLQEIRLGVEGRGGLSCSCPDKESAIKCKLSELKARVQMQGRLGYQDEQARLIGIITGGGEWNLLTGETSLFGSWNIAAQIKTPEKDWLGFNMGGGGNILLPGHLPSISGGEFSIPLPTTCECMKFEKKDIDGTGKFFGLF